MISLADYFMGRDALHPDELSERHRIDAGLTVARANLLLARAGLCRSVTSGWRPRAVNARIANASPRSRHISCQAIDLADDDGALDTWCLAHLDALVDLGLWLEHPDATPGWCHVQTVPPGSGRRVFEP